ncbi:MAG: type II toxin-antitoxin system mRNA interferase toxin, RelE/StbE family [Okeania sp. SIO3I5]|nr:type II toxin-antitoxin system mRNA interferase toxin, RelE/StbE family [Okeania sp. SIO3I5]
MREIVLTPRFKRSFRKFVKRNSQLEQKILQTIKLMQEDIFATSLSTHSLQGKLLGLKAFSCGYDCRIVFSLEIDKNTTEEVIILIDIGTHDMVY